MHHDLALYLVVLMYYVLELSYEVALFDLESIVCIATVYIDLQIHYITSFCILTIYTHTFLCIFVRIYICRELLTVVLHTLHIPQRTTAVSIEHSLQYTQAFYTINIELHVEFPKAALTEKAPQQNSLYLKMLT